MIDDKDSRIIAELVVDSRRSTAEIARATGIPRVTVHDRIQKLVDGGVIRRFTAVLDHAKLGFPLTAYILVSYESNPELSQKDVAKRMTKVMGVNEVHIITGQWDYLIKVRSRSMAEIGDLIVERLRRIPGVGGTVTCVSFWSFKEEH